MGCATRARAGFGIVFRAAEVKFQILTCAEIAAGASDDDHLGLIVFLGPVERIAHINMQLRAHGVSFFGTIEDNKSSRAIAFYFDVFKREYIAHKF